MTIHNGHAYVIDGKEIYCHSLADGKLLASIDGVGTSTSPQLLSADGKIFYLPEGRHGAPHDVFLFNADPKKFEKITDYWPGMLHVPTTAYAGHNMLYPIVDGRIFARGLDGIFCYDLRAKSQ